MLQVNNGSACTLEIRQLFGESFFAHTAVSEGACLLRTPLGQVEVITHLVSTLRRASLMLALNHLLIKMEETFVNILKMLLRTFLCGFYIKIFVKDYTELDIPEILDTLRRPGLKHPHVFGG
jgi:hypothetical protein